MGKHSTANKERMGYIWLPLLLVGVFLAAYLLTVHAFPGGAPKPALPKKARAIPKPYPHDDHLPKTKIANRRDSGKLDGKAYAEGAIPNQRIITFQDKAAMDRFLAEMGNGLNVLGRIDKLNTLLIGFGSESDLLAMLDGSEESSYNFPAYIPGLPDGGVQEGAVPLGAGLLKWLGIEGDNSLWGTGVKIAVLDTGIADHIVFGKPIQRINLVPLPTDLSTLNGHGTDAASIIFSNNAFAPGVAPGATPISIRIANDDGISSTFLIAGGIHAALDAGADVINLSMGGSQRSGLVDDAMAEAARRGVPVIVAAGNTGGPVLYPASNPTAIAVGAVDRNNQSMAFSSRGPQIALSAAGYGLNAAYPGDKAVSFSGTSASGPVMTGLVGAISSPNGQVVRSAVQSVGMILENSRDVGAQGADEATGAGVPYVPTILNPRPYDAAVNSISVVRGQVGNQVQVLVQNLGTETLINTGVSVNINGATTNANIPSLLPRQSKFITVATGGGESLDITGSVQLSGSQKDQRPANDSISQTVPAAP